MRDWNPQHPFRRCLAWLGTAAVVGCSENTVTEPGVITLGVSQTQLTISQGGSSGLVATLTRSGDDVGALDLTVEGAPLGVTSTVSDVQTVGRVTTATITISVAGTVAPGSYQLYVHGIGRGVGATAAVMLTVTWVAVPCLGPGTVCEQWATNATASSEYSPGEWNAFRATGAPDVPACTDDASAWASAEPDGADWLELTYPESVQPTEILVYESFGVSSIVKVEVRESSGAYHTVYDAVPGSHTCPRVLSIPVTGIAAAVGVVRVSVDQSVLKDWNKIDAVKLIGIR